MMKMIGLNEVVFVSAISSMRDAADGISTQAESWTSMGENSTVFEEYLNQYAQLQSIFLTYQRLLYKDIKAIEIIGDKISEADERIAELWK